MKYWSHHKVQIHNENENENENENNSYFQKLCCF